MGLQYVSPHHYLATNLVGCTRRQDISNTPSSHSQGEVSPRDVLDSLFPVEAFRRLEGQLIRVIPPVTVVRVVTEMVVCTAKMRWGMHGVIDTVAERRSKSGRVNPMMCMMFWVFDGRCTIAIFARLSQMARHWHRHHFGFEARKHVGWSGGRRLNGPGQIDPCYSIGNEQAVMRSQQARGHAFNDLIPSKTYRRERNIKSSNLATTEAATDSTSKGPRRWRSGEALPPGCLLD